MSPDRRNRPQLSPFEMSHFEGVVRDRKIQVGPARHQKHAPPDPLQSANEITLIEFVCADIGSQPGRSLGVEILGLPSREARLPVMIEEIVEIGGAGAGQMKVGAIPVLAAPSSCDLALRISSTGI